MSLTPHSQSLSSADSASPVSSLYCDEDAGEVVQLYSDSWISNHRPQSPSFYGYSPPSDENSVNRLIDSELHFLPLSDYLHRCREHSIDVTTRQDSINWILKVHAYYRFRPVTLLLAVNYFDRFLSSHPLMVPNVTDVGLKPRQIKKVAVIGGGLMGSGIATALILSNISVVLKEINSEYLRKGIKMIEANVQGLVTRGKLAQDKGDKALSMLEGLLGYSAFKDVDMVIEAVIESVPLKQIFFSEIEKACPPHCILATNTSTIDLNVVGEKTSA